MCPLAGGITHLFLVKLLAWESGEHAFLREHFVHLEWVAMMRIMIRRYSDNMISFVGEHTRPFPGHIWPLRILDTVSLCAKFRIVADHLASPASQRIMCSFVRHICQLSVSAFSTCVWLRFPLHARVKCLAGHQKWASFMFPSAVHFNFIRVHSNFIANCELLCVLQRKSVSWVYTNDIVCPVWTLTCYVRTLLLSECVTACRQYIRYM